MIRRYTITIVAIGLLAGLLVGALSYMAIRKLWPSVDERANEVAQVRLPDGAPGIYEKVLGLIDELDPPSRSLFVAAMQDQRDTVQLLLDVGGDPDGPIPEQFTPLALACAVGNEDTAKLLVETGADVSCPSALFLGMEAIHLAAMKGAPTIVALLIKKGADPNALLRLQARDIRWSTRDVLGLSVDEFERRIAKFDIPPDQDLAGTPLHFAAMSKSHNAGDVIDVLVSNGARVGTRGADGQTPLHCAAETGNLDAVRALVAKQAEIDAKDKLGSTPLHLASWKGSSEIVELLIRHGADINGRGIDGATALHYAAQENRLEVAATLLANGAELDATGGRDRGYTSLHVACLHGSADVARFLLDKGADVNRASGSKGLTPLHMAAGEGNMGLVRMLVEEGADVGIRDVEGATASDTASANGHVEVARALQTASEKRE